MIDTVLKMTGRRTEGVCSARDWMHLVFGIETCRRDLEDRVLFAGPGLYGRLIKRDFMTSSKEQAAEFRRRAAACLEVAKRMSLEEDRIRMM